MSTLEHSVPLTEADRNLLQAEKKRHLTHAIFQTLGAVLLLLPVFLAPNLCLIVVLLLTSLVLLFAALVSLLSFLSVQRDLRESQKKVITGPIEDQNMDVKRRKDRHGIEGPASYTFWVKVGGRKLTVTEEQYYQLKKGDQVEALLGPHSGTLLGINKYAETGEHPDQA